MADQAGGQLSGTLGGTLGSLQSKVIALISKVQEWIDGVIPPERRARIMEKARQFATDRPFLASFLVSWFTFSGLPLGLYIAFCVTVALLALVIGLVLALLGTILFIVTMAGLALMVLFPVLFFTTFCAIVVFGWGVGLWYLVKWTKKDQILSDVNKQVRGLLGQDAGEFNTKVHPDNADGASHETKKKTSDGDNGETSQKKHPGHKTHAGSRDIGGDTVLNPNPNQTVSGIAGGLTA